MSVTHPKGPTQRASDLSIQPIFEIEGNRIPRQSEPAVAGAAASNFHH